MREAWIIDGVRSPRGRGKPTGSLHDVHPQELLALDHDEHPRPDTTLESLAALQASFEELGSRRPAGSDDRAHHHVHRGRHGNSHHHRASLNAGSRTSNWPRSLDWLGRSPAGWSR
jgi:acetyl-CoA acetyltransferase